MIARLVADRGILWPLIAAVLGSTGGRFGRRAALRGVLSGLLASALAKAPVKWLAGTSHTATAFGFATGIGQELPVLAAPAGALAGIVGYAGIHAGLHQPTAALAGAALGVGAGLATRRVWPVAPHSPAETAAVNPSGSVPPSPTGRGVVVVVNHDAGTGGKVVAELHDELPEAEVVEVDDGSRLGDVLRHVASHASALGVAGGDGSVNAAAEVASARRLPLMVVPAGTLNHFAQALGIVSVADAAVAVREGRVLEVDRATIDGHTFVNTASIGSYVELVDSREKLEDRIGKWPAVVVALVGVLRRAQTIDVEIDGERRRVWMVFVGNCRYHPAGFGPSWRERLDDGQLDIRIVDGSRPWSRLRLLLAVVTGRLGRCRAYEQRYQRTLAVRSASGPLRLARDGETFTGPEELTIAKCDDPLLVYVPER